MQSQSQPLHQQSLQEIIETCAQEAREQLRESELGSCFELFRRAFEEGEEAAWTAVQAQYQRLVIDWLRKASAQPLLPADLDDLIQTAYTKFWYSLSKSEESLKARFEHVGAVLKYLNRCVVTSCLDAGRKAERRRRLEQKMSRLAAHEGFERPVYDLGEESEAQLGRVQAWLQKEVDDPLEQLAIKLLYEEGLKPREIVAQYPEAFPDTYTLRRIKARVLQRARRALT